MIDSENPSMTAIAWNRDGFEVVDTTDGIPDGRVMRFGVADVPQLVLHVKDRGHSSVVVIESTNGVLDGRLMAAGLSVYRIDEGSLPERPRFGSVCAMDIALAALSDIHSLTELERGRGTQTGREHLLNMAARRCEAQLTRIESAGGAIRRGGTSNSVAITFDDGPLPESTSRVLDLLDGYDVNATFFCAGSNAAAYPEQLFRMRDSGHLIGNHTWSHPFLEQLSVPELARQVDETWNAIDSVVGEPPVRYFRPPYGSMSPSVLEWLNRSANCIALWDVAPDDWAMPGAAEITRRVLSQVRGGSIVLLHDGGGDRSQTIDALPRIIDGILARGWSLVTLAELGPGAAHA